MNKTKSTKKKVINIKDLTLKQTIVIGYGFFIDRDTLIGYIEKYLMNEISNKENNTNCRILNKVNDAEFHNMPHESINPFLSRFDIVVKKISYDTYAIIHHRPEVISVSNDPEFTYLGHMKIRNLIPPIDIYQILVRMRAGLPINVSVMTKKELNNYYNIMESKSDDVDLIVFSKID